MSFQLLIHSQPSFYNRHIPEMTNYMKGETKCQLEKVNNDKYFSRWHCSKNDGSVLIFDNSEFELYKNITDW